MERTAPGVSSSTVKISIATAVGLVVAGLCWRVVWFLARQWPLWVAVGVTVAGFRLYGWLGTYGASGAGVGLVAALVAWGLLHRRSFAVLVYWPLRGWARHLFVYGVGWRELMAVCGLTKTVRERKRKAPRLVRVRSTSTVDRVRVRTLHGQTLADFADNTDRFAENISAADCRVRRLRWPAVTILGRRFGGKVRARVLELWFLIVDPLAERVPLFPIPARPNLRRLALALCEDGLTWTLRLLGTHVLLAGQTGSGKSGVLWSLIRALAAGIRDGLVAVWVIDPKGGMELAAGQALFARYCYGDDPKTATESQRRVFQTAYAEFLEALVDELRERQQRLRGIVRTHRARPGDPHIVLVIDELAAVTAYVTDRKVKARIEDALALILSQGRSCGITVVAALQDARKEVLSLRGLFPTRIGLALGEEEETDLILGRTARKNGARCDQIDEDTPGVAYVAVEDSREPVRVRFAYVDDEEIARLASEYGPGGRTLRAVDDPENTKELVL